MNLGWAVKKTMARKGIRGADLARSMGTTKSYVSRIVTGHYENMGIATIARIAGALDVDPEDLVALARKAPD